MQSLREHADMPYELIVHNDSGYEPFEELSTQICNYGPNLGLSRSTHNAVNLASSNLILFMNQDCVMLHPCLKDIRNVLSKPYVGYVLPLEHTIEVTEWCNVNGTKVGIAPGGAGGGSVIAFRRDAWNQVGGMDLRSHSGSADCSFCCRLLKAGFWRGTWQGDNCFRNISLEEHQNTDSSFSKRPGPVLDCNLPLIWKHPNYEQTCRERMKDCCKYTGEQVESEAGTNNSHYWHQYTLDLIPRGPSSINWTVAARHGQDQWRSLIEADYEKS